VRPLTNPVRTYAWGSRTAIAAMQGRPVPSPRPEAELWMGAHATAPSWVSEPDGPSALDEAIARDPERALGRAVVDRFGGHLPYLLKVLAAARPVSLQAHPDEARARDGFAAESALALDDPRRNYRDPHHKPEMLVAVEPFEALCGFRDPDASARDLDAYGVPALAPVITTLRSGPVRDRLRGGMELLLRLPVEVVAAVAAAGPDTLAGRLAAAYPGDAGALVALLLNHVRLRPDEAVFMPAGNLHTYLDGVGVEVMAASDNVLRGGLTEKHVDVAELLRVLRYEVLTDPVVRPDEVAPGVLTWPVPVAEFALVKASPRADAGPVTLPGAGPRIVVCLAGRAELRVAGGPAGPALAGGDAVFVPATEPAVEVSGTATVFQAAPGL